MDANYKNTQETKEENYAVANSGCTGNFMAVSTNLNSLQATKKPSIQNLLMDRYSDKKWKGNWIHLCYQTKKYRHIFYQKQKIH